MSKRVGLAFLICMVLVGSSQAMFEFMVNADQITHLPGLEVQPSFRQYSGYLEATGGRHLHYWFVESKGSPFDDPVVLWLNGGPGCSSLGGFLSEQGPFHVNPKNTSHLDINADSWNNHANVIFMEAPAGVGFSYKDDGNYSTDDIQTAIDNYAAIQSFFKKFPQFAENEFYVTGESYGGIYVPTLSVNILRGAANINFKGFAIGNGLLDDKKNSISSYFFSFFHGLVGTAQWNDMTQKCCKDGNVTLYTCDFTEENCPESANIMLDRLAQDINPYNIYDDCEVLGKRVNIHPKKTRDYWGKYMWVKSAGYHRNRQILRALEDTPSCITDIEIAAYLNQDDVKRALHIKEGLPAWEMCGGIDYNSNYDNMKAQVLELIRSNRQLRGVIYNGDVDSVCNYLGDEWFVDDLGLEKDVAYDEWMYKGVVGGWYKHFVGNGPGLTFMTIRGAGHMVPHDKGGPASKLIDFVTGRAQL